MHATNPPPQLVKKSACGVISKILASAKGTSVYVCGNPEEVPSGTAVCNRFFDRPHAEVPPTSLSLDDPLRSTLTDI